MTIQSMATLHVPAFFMMIITLPTLGHSESATNAFNDPFQQVTSGIAGCPVPMGPLYTASEAKAQSHYRIERGTSCFQSGRCRLPNSYLYDKEIAPRAKRFLTQDGRFDRSSLWIAVQRRWVTVMGCVESVAMGKEVVRSIQGIDDVEAVIGQWSPNLSNVPYPTVNERTRSAAPP